MTSDRRAPARRSSRFDLVSIAEPDRRRAGDGRADAGRARRASGLHVQWQQVEDGRPNVLGTWEGAGGGPTLMFNGHMDTSYSGREPWLRGIRGFQPQGVRAATAASTASASRT